MSAKSKKTVAVISAVLALILIPLGVAAVKNGIAPKTKSGGFVQKTVDRINLTVDSTEFSFDFSDNGVYTLSFEFTAEKTEAEFYGRLDSFAVTGLDTEYTLLTAVDGSSEYVLDAAVLPAKDGKAEKLVWSVEAPCKIDGRGTFTGEIAIEYTSGITQEQADSHLLKIPLTITVK